MTAVKRIRVRRPKVRTKCAHCGRKRLPKFIEWHPGIDEWQCSNFSDCDKAIERNDQQKRDALR